MVVRCDHEGDHRQVTDSEDREQYGQALREMTEGKRRLYAALAGSVTRGGQRVLEGARHSTITTDHPDAVVQAIRDLPEEARRRRAQLPGPRSTLRQRYMQVNGMTAKVAVSAADFWERITPMTEDEKSIYGVVPRLVQEFLGQLRASTERLEDLTGSSGSLPLVPGASGAFPLPGGLSAAQMKSIAGSITAQRHSIAALSAQLSSFDEQLAVLEQLLGPLTEWSKTWADLEDRLLNTGRKPEAGR